MSNASPLLSRIADPKNLAAAWLRVGTKGSAGGYDGEAVEDFGRQAEENLRRLGAELLAQTYVPEPLLSVAVPKGPHTTERRVLGLPSVRDKVAQDATREVVEPLLQREFLDASYGYRRGKGPQKAIGRVRHYLANLRFTWAVVADIDDFFGSLNHDLLLRRLAEKLDDPSVVRLVELWLKMGAVDKRGRWRDVRSGVAQGGVISPLLANFYLHPFDCFVTDMGEDVGLVRYADDFVILARKRADAEEAHQHAVAYLERELSLRLNACLRPVVPVEEGFDFLGIRFTGAEVSIAEAKLVKIRAKLEGLCGGPGPKPLAERIKALNEAVAGWHRYYGAVVPEGEFRKIEDRAVAALQNAVAGALRHRVLPGAGAAKEVLDSLDLPTARDPAAHRRLVNRIVDAARAQARPVATAKTGRPPPRVASAVRRRKVQHTRRQASLSELVLNTPGTFLGKSGGRIVVRQSRRIVLDVPALNVSSITVACHGVSLSADVVAYCAEHDIPILFVEYPGRVRALLHAPLSAAAELQALQIRAAQAPSSCCAVARQFVLGKIKNQRNLAQYLGKYHKRATPGFRAALDALLDRSDALLGELKAVSAGADDSFRGLLFSVEGRFASLYWDVIGALLNGRVNFPGRRHEGASDLVNSLLNYGYAILESRVHLAILKAGLSPQIGFLHTLQRRRASLVYDLMEELRPQVVDRTVVSLVSRREPLTLDADSRLTAETRKLLITHVSERLATIVEFHDREMRIDEIISAQARALARHLRGEANYRPFVAKW